MSCLPELRFMEQGLVRAAPSVKTRQLYCKGKSLHQMRTILAKALWATLEPYH